MEITSQIDKYLRFCTEVKRFSNRTMAIKKVAIRLFLEHSKITDLSQISNWQIDDWVSSMTSRGLAGRSINNYLAQLTVMLKWQKDEGVNMPNLRISRIAQAKTQPPRKVSYSREEIARVLSSASPEAALMIRICFDCGLRISELRNMRLGDISGTRIKIIGKGSKERMVYMSPKTRKILVKWIRKNGLTDYIWPSLMSKNEPRCVDLIRQELKQTFIDAGYDNFYPHALRHSFASDMYKNGAPIRIIQKALGHTSSMTTERYLDAIGQNELKRNWDEYKYNRRRAKLV